MAKTYSVQEIQQKLAKHIEGMIDRVAGDIQDLAKREQIKKSLWATAHEEPGQHEAVEPGVAPHMEPGKDEHFEMNPTAGPDAATAAPIQGGNGVPPGQLADPNHQLISQTMGDGPCPLCQQPEQGCKCLDSMVLGKSLEKGDSDDHYNHYLVHNSTGKVHGGYEFKQDAHDAAKDHEHAGHLKVTHRSGVPHAAKEAFHRENDSMEKLHKDDIGMGGAGTLEMKEVAKGGLMSGGQSMGGASAGMGGGPGGALSMSEEDGRNSDPSKKQPGKPVDGAKMPPEAPKQIKSQDGKKPKENPLGKVGVPEAKPPSGKVPGGTSAPPMASTTSKPGVTKEEPIAKAVMNPQMQQHANIDASKAAAPGAGAVPKPALTHPADMSRANAHASAMGGAFQPKGPISSGLELAGKPGAAPAPAPGAKLPAPGGMAPKGLAPPGAAARGAAPAPGGMQKPAGMAVPKPMGMPMAAPGAAPVAKPGIFGKLFGKSEKCALCGKEEHLGQCK